MNQMTGESANSKPQKRIIDLAIGVLIAAGAILLFIMLSFSCSAQLPYEQAEGWNQITDASCNKWLKSTNALNTATHPQRVLVNAEKGDFIEGLWSGQWQDGKGTDAFITTWFNHAEYDVQLILSDNSYTKSVTTKTIASETGTVNYLACAGYQNTENNAKGFYAPVEFSDFNIPEDKNVIGARVVMAGSVKGPDFGQFVITSNAKRSSKNCAEAPHVSTTIVNTKCPVAVNLNKLLTISSPVESVYMWSVDPDPENGFQMKNHPEDLNNDGILDNPTKVTTEGSYHVFLYDFVNDCFSTGTMVSVKCFYTESVLEIDSEVAALDESSTDVISSQREFGTYQPPTNFLVTPNGDGINDTFSISTHNRDSRQELSIYNRWGSKVYHQYAYNNTWNGQSNVKGSGEMLLEGTYFFVLELDEQFNYTGYLQLQL